MKRRFVGNNDYKVKFGQMVDSIVPKPVKLIVNELRDQGIEAECCDRVIRLKHESFLLR